MRESNLDISCLGFNVNARFLSDMQVLFLKAMRIDFGIVDAPPRAQRASYLLKTAVNELLRLLPEARAAWETSAWISCPETSYGRVSMSNTALLTILCAIGKINYPGVKARTWRIIHEVVL